MLRLATCIAVILWAVLVRDGAAQSRLLLKPGDSLPSSRVDAVVRDFERLRSNRFGELFATADAKAASGQFAGVWRVDIRTGQTILVVEDGASVPGIDGAIFDEPFAEDLATVVRQDGGLGLILAYSAPESEASGYGTWYWDVSGGLTQLLLQNQPAPGLADQFVHDPEVGGVNGLAGLASVFADAVPEGSLVPKNDATWVRDASDVFHLVAVTGTSAPGVPDQILDGEPRVNWMNNRGQYLLHAGVNTAGGAPIESRSAIWLAGEGVGGPLRHVLTQGDDLPVSSGSVPVQSFNVNDFNVEGDLVLTGNYAGDDDTLTGLWMYTAESGFRHLVSEGDVLPGLEPFEFEQLSAVDLSDTGEVLIQNNHPSFHAHYGPGLWLSSVNRGLEPVLVSGQSCAGNGNRILGLRNNIPKCGRPDCCGGSLGK